MSEPKRKLSLSRLINNNKAILIFSIIIAVIFWLTIKIGQNTTTIRTITDITVNITTEDTAVGALGLDVISGGTNQKVNVRVQGPSYVVNALTSSDILVTASMSDVTAAGTYRLPLVATKNGTTLTGYLRQHLDQELHAGRLRRRCQGNRGSDRRVGGDHRHGLFYNRDQRPGHRTAKNRFGTGLRRGEQDPLCDREF